ncbi:MAG: glycosyltransferase family 2 protein [Acidobacteriota bacterium]
MNNSLRPPGGPHRRDEAKSPHRLAIVVLTWNGREETLACLESLSKAGHPRQGEAVVVVDNGSSDGTLEAVAQRFPWAVGLQNGANLGFAGGNNAGLRWALERGYGAVLLLNNDTEVEGGALSTLLAALEDPTVGAAQPLLLSFADPSRIDSAGIELFSLPGARDMHIGGPAAKIFGEPREIFGCCAAAALYRAEALRAAGLLDEDFFVLLEDVDLAFRVRLAGYRALLVPGARIRHKRGISAQGRLSGEKKYLLHRNILALAWRYWPWRYLLQFAPFLLKGWLWGFLRALRTGRRKEWARLMGRSRALRRQYRKKPRWREIQRRWMRSLGWGYYGRKVRERLGGPPALPL